MKTKNLIHLFIALMLLNCSFKTNSLFGAVRNPPRAGLANLGNTCFMNASLQTLTNIEPFNQILDNDHKAALTNALWKLKEHLLQDKNPYDPTNFYNNANTAGIETIIKNHNKNKEQQDAAEFIIQLLNKINKEASGIFSFDQVSIRTSRKNTDVLSTKLEKIFIVPLPLTKKYDLTLVDLINEYTKEEEIDYHYDEGTPKAYWGKANKQLLFASIPQVFIFTLNRFAAGEQIKNKKYVEIPLKLDVQPYLTNDAKKKFKQTTYKLIGIINHIGDTIAYGHYIAYINDYRDNNWYKCDDNVVSQILDINTELKSVPNSTPYILFYQKQEAKVEPPQKPAVPHHKIPTIPSPQPTTPQMTDDQIIAEKRHSNAYILLGVDQNAPNLKQNLSKAYRTLSMACHPDKNPKNKIIAEKAQKILNDIKRYYIDEQTIPTEVRDPFNPEVVLCVEEKRVPLEYNLQDDKSVSFDVYKFIVNKRQCKQEEKRKQEEDLRRQEQIHKDEELARKIAEEQKLEEEKPVEEKESKEKLSQDIKTQVIKHLNASQVQLSRRSIPGAKKPFTDAVNLLKEKNFLNEKKANQLIKNFNVPLDKAQKTLQEVRDMLK